MLKRLKAKTDGYIPQALLLLGMFVLYLHTIAPTITVADSAELASAAFTLGIAHNPGYPTYVLLGKLFSLLPPGNPAFRMNLFSCTFSLVSLALLYALLEKITRNSIAAALGAFFLGLSPLFWNYATIAEVFSLNDAFCLLLLLLLFLYESRKDIRHLYLLSFCLGLGFGNHETLIFLAFPAALYLCLQPEIRRAAALLRLAGLFLIGLSIYLYLPLRGHEDPLVNLGLQPGAREFIRYVLRLNTGTVRLGAIQEPQSIRYIWPQIAIYFKNLAAEFYWPGLVLGLIGLAASFKAHRFAWILLLTFIFSSFGFFALARIAPTPLIVGTIDKFYVMPDSIFAVWIGFGVNVLWQAFPYRWCKTAFAGSLAIFLLFKGYSVFGIENKRNDYISYDYAQNILRTLPPHSFLISSGMDSTDFALLYMRDVLGERLDVSIRSRGTAFPLITSRTANEVMTYPGRIYYAAEGVSPIFGFRTQPAGILQEIARQRKFPSRFAPWYAMRGLNDGRVPSDYYEREVLANYPYFMGYSALSRGELARAQQDFQEASYLGGNVEWVNNNIGALYHEHDMNTLAARYLKESIKRDPYYIYSYLNLALLDAQGGSAAEALTLAQTALSLSPKSAATSFVLKTLKSSRGN